MSAACCLELNRRRPSLCWLDRFGLGALDPPHLRSTEARSTGWMYLVVLWSVNRKATKAFFIGKCFFFFTRREAHLFVSGSYPHVLPLVYGRWAFAHDSAFVFWADLLRTRLLCIAVVNFQGSPQRARARGIDPEREVSGLVRRKTMPV